MPNVNTIDLTPAAGAILIAEASSYNSEDEDQRRWTDLEVYVRPGKSPRFVAQAVGVSSIDGETDRVRRLAGSTLAKVLRLFEGVDGTEPTPLGKVVINLANEWNQDQSFKGSTISAALYWLYQGLDLDESVTTRAARDFGTTPRPYQKALAAEASTPPGEITVTVPLLAILPFLDRHAFQVASMARAAAE